MTDKVIKLAAVGDIALTHDYDELLTTKGPHYPFNHIRNFFKDYDIVFGNLEAPFFLKGETFPLKCSLRSNPRYVEGLKEALYNTFLYLVPERKPPILRCPMPIFSTGPSRVGYDQMTFHKKYKSGS